MGYTGNALDFMTSAEGERLIWYWDRNAKEIVTECECCGAQARHTEEQLDADFAFEHEVECESGFSLKGEWCDGRDRS